MESINETKSRFDTWKDDYQYDIDVVDPAALEFDWDELTDDLLKYDLDAEDSTAFEFDWNELPDDLLKYDIDVEDFDYFEAVSLSRQESSYTDPQPVSVKIRNRFIAVFTMVAAFGLLISAWSLGKPYFEEYLSEQKVKAFKPEHASAFSESAGTVVREDTSNIMENPYTNLFDRNEDMVAWLLVDDTEIDYPVMQTMEDEEYYLYRDFYGESDKSGCLLLDTGSSLFDSTATSNLIIHGHNMKLGTMFGTLERYKDPDYWQGHQNIELYTENELREYQVIAVFYSQVYYPSNKVFKYYNFFHADTEESFADFYSNIKALSLYDTGVEARLGDQFLTLSTCAYHVEEGRFVVVCKEYSRSQVHAGT